MGSQGSKKAVQVPRAALTCLEGDEAPHDEWGDAMGQSPHAPSDGVPHEPRKAPRRDQGEQRAETLVGKEAQQGKPPQGTSDRVLCVFPPSASAGGAMDGAGCRPGWVRSSGCSAVTCPMFHSWKDSREQHCHRDATVVRVWEVTVLWSPPSHCQLPAGLGADPYCDHDRAKCPQSICFPLHEGSSCRQGIKLGCIIYSRAAGLHELKQWGAQVCP